MADRDLYGGSDRSYAIDRPQQTAFRNYHPSSPGATPMTPWMAEENKNRQDLYTEGLRRDIEGDYSNRQPGVGIANLRPRIPLPPHVNPRMRKKGIETLSPTGPGWIDDNYYPPEHPIWGRRIDELGPEILTAEASGDSFDAMRHELYRIGIDPTGMGDDEVRQIYDINIGGTTGAEDQFGVSIDPSDWRILQQIIRAGGNPDDYVETARASNRGGIMSFNSGGSPHLDRPGRIPFDDNMKDQMYDWILQQIWRQKEREKMEEDMRMPYVAPDATLEA